MSTVIAPGCTVTIEYELRTREGEPIESSMNRGPLTFIHGQRVMLPGLGPKLEGLAEGQEVELTLQPEEAFGRIEDAPTKIIPRSEFPKGAKFEIGMSFQAALPGGQSIQLVIGGATEQEITARMVHPLAGRALTMKIKVVSVEPPAAAS